MSNASSLFLLALALLAGCATRQEGCFKPVRGLPERPLVMPSGPLQDDEAARIALANNPAFQELAADLGISEAQLRQARELPNPTLTVLFPLGPKQLEFTSKFAADAIWLRPARVKAAKLDATKVERLVRQAGLDLTRDVKQACADLRFAERQLALAAQAATLLDQIATMAEARLRAGDVGEVEAAGVRNEARLAQLTVERLPGDVETARERLRQLMGLSAMPDVTLTLRPARALPVQLPPEGSLREQALATRPDLRAAEIAMEAEIRRARLTRFDRLPALGIADANGTGDDFEMGPGLDLTLPLFHQNQGARAVADAKVEKAALHCETVRATVASEVRLARVRYLQAQQSATRIRDEIEPALAESISQTETAFSSGNVSYLVVLESHRALQTVRVQRAEAEAAWQRAAAELERAIGVEFPGS